MRVIGIVKNETTPKIRTDETMFTLTSSGSHRGGGMAVVIRTERENDISESDRQPNGE